MVRATAERSTESMGAPHRWTEPELGRSTPVIARKQARLAGTVGPDESDALAAADLVSQGFDDDGAVPVGDRHVVCREDRLHAPSQLVARARALEQEQEERSAEQRHHDTDRDVPHQPCDEVGGGQ